MALCRLCECCGVRRCLWMSYACIDFEMAFFQYIRSFSRCECQECFLQSLELSKGGDRFSFLAGSFPYCPWVLILSFFSSFSIIRPFFFSGCGLACQDAFSGLLFFVQRSVGVLFSRCYSPYSPSESFVCFMCADRH